MANNESIGSFVDPKSAEEIQNLTQYVSLLAEATAEASIAAAELLKSFGGNVSLREMIDLTNKAAAANNAISDSATKVKSTVKLLNEEQIRANLTIKEQNDLLKLNVAAQEAPAGSIAKVRAEAALLRNELNKLNLEQQPVLQEVLRNKLATLDGFIKNNVDAYTAQKINIGNYPETIASMAKIRAEMDELARTGQKDSVEFRQLSGTLQEFQAGLGPTSVQLSSVTTSMQNLSSQMYVMKDAGLMDTAEFKLLNEQFELLAARGAELKAQMAGVGVAIKEAGEHSERGAIAMEKFTETIKEIGSFALTFFGIQAGMEFIGGISEEFEKADKAARNLKNTLDNVGAKNSFGTLTKEAEEFADKFSYLDTYEVQNVFSKLITYGKLTEDQIKEALPVIIDFAAKTGNTLEVSAGLIIKSLEGSSRGLKEFGINIKEAKTATGEALPQAERFGFIMEQLKPRVAGAAIAFKDGWSGTVESWKKQVREIELGFADLFVKMSGIESKQLQQAIATKKEADGAQNLMNEYKELSSKVNQTAADKEKLSSITTSLTAIYGNSVVSINEETGAIQLNIQATEDLIKQKLLLADTEAARYANIYNKFDKERVELLEAAAKQQAVYNAAVKETGITEAQVNSKLFNRDSPVPFENLSEGEKKIVKLSDALNKLKGEYRDADQAAKGALDKLKGFGYDESDVKRLFKPEEIDPTKGIPGIPGGVKEKDTAIANEKALSAELLAQYQVNIKAKADEQKAIADNENESYENRKEALKEYLKFQHLAASAALLTEREQTEFELSNTTQKPKETDQSYAQRKNLLNLHLKGIDDRQKQLNLEDDAKFYDEKQKLDQKYVDEKIALLKVVDDRATNNETDELKNEQTRYDLGLISKDKYEKDKAEIERKYARARLIMQKQILENSIADNKDKGIDSSKEEGLLSGVNNSIKSLPSKPKDVSDNPALAAFGLSDKDYEKAQQIASGILNLEGAITKAIDARYQLEIDRLNEKQNLINANYEKEKSAIAGSVLSERQKNVALTQLVAQKAIQDKQIHDEIIAEKRKMAAADKVAATAEAIEAGIVAVISTFKIDPTGILAGIVGAAAAVKIAEIASAPLPQYGTGMEDHPGGWAEVGELNKPEWIFEPGKSPYMVKTSTKINLAKHARVVPEADLISDSMTVGLDGQLVQINNIPDFSRLEEAIDRGNSRVEKAITNMPQTTFIASGGELTKVVKVGNSKYVFADKNFK